MFVFHNFIYRTFIYNKDFFINKNWFKNNILYYYIII
jgi:hypothetical protein